MDQSGLVITWSFLGPIGALIFLSNRQAVGWMAMFLGIVVISAAFEPALLGYSLTVSDPTRILFYSMNLGVPTSIVFAASAWFVHTIQQAHAEAQHKSEELQAALSELHDTQARLIHAAKMASLGQLTAGIAHEIKNPLNFVNNFSALSVELVEEIEEACAANKDLSFSDLREEFYTLKLNSLQIAALGRRADTIVNAMMEHARVGSERQPMPVDLNEVVEKNVGLAYHGLRNTSAALDIFIEQRYDDALEPVTIVPEEIGRVVINLLNNAFDAVQMRAKASEAAYTPSVMVSTRQADPGQEAGPKEPTRRYVEIRVQDNGPGISEDSKGKIFEPFFTTKPTGSGTGLGLSMSYDIVTKGHEGRLRVESEPGSGATFIIELPN